MRANGGRRARHPRKVNTYRAGVIRFIFCKRRARCQRPAQDGLLVTWICPGMRAYLPNPLAYAPHNRQLRHLFFRFCKSWFLNPHSHSMASVLTSRHSNCIQFSVPSRIECRQVTPCRASSASGSKIGTTSKTFFKLRVLVFVFVPKGAAGRLWRLDSAENARFETQAPFCLLAASCNRK